MQLSFVFKRKKKFQRLAVFEASLLSLCLSSRFSLSLLLHCHCSFVLVVILYPISVNLFPRRIDFTAPESPSFSTSEVKVLKMLRCTEEVIVIYNINLLKNERSKTLRSSSDFKFK